MTKWVRLPNHEKLCKCLNIPHFKHNGPTSTLRYSCHDRGLPCDGLGFNWICINFSPIRTVVWVLVNFKFWHQNPQAHAICDSWGSHSSAVQDSSVLGFLKTSFSHIIWLHLVLNWRQLTLCKIFGSHCGECSEIIFGLLVCERCIWINKTTDYYGTTRKVFNIE